MVADIIKQSSGCTVDFTEDVLRAHNECRAKHGVPSVTWCPGLAEEAQKWANRLAKSGKLKHCNKLPSDQGENIACAGGQPLTGDKATGMWYSEIKDYDFNKTAKYNPSCGHFTQVVWKDTKEIGAAIATSKKGMHFVVGRYRPGGNQLSDFPQNVLPPSGDDIITASNVSDVHCEPGEPTVKSGKSEPPVKSERPANQQSVWRTTSPDDKDLGRKERIEFTQIFNFKEETKPSKNGTTTKISVREKETRAGLRHNRWNNEADCSFLNPQKNYNVTHCHY